MYLINPAKRRKRKVRKAKKSRPFSSKNPMKKSRRKARRSFARRNPARRRRRRAMVRRNPARRRRSSLRRAISLNPSMKNSTRRRRRRSFARMNPVRRRRGFSLRNPGGPVDTIFNNDILTLSGGVVISTIGANLILNKLLLPNAAGQIPMKLPGVDTTKAGYMTSLPVTFYKLLIAGGAGYLLRNRSPRLAQGLIIGAVATTISDVVRQSNLLSQLPGGTAALGVSRYFGSPRRGMNAYTPGVPAIFTGPASGFIGGGSPGARRGAGTMVGPGFARMAATQVPNPFST